MFIQTNSLSTRLVRPEDGPLLYDLFCSVRALELEQAALSPDQKEMHLRSQFEAMHSSYAERFPNGEHRIIRFQGQDVGRIYTNISSDEIRLLDIIVTPDLRNRGIGGQLMKQMISYSEETEKAVRFYVWQANEQAQRFYVRHGFSQTHQEGPYLLYERYPNGKKLSAPVAD
ncbi:MAG: GNAT family N-acetyltransferase [Chloroflexota bacterium]